MRLQAAIARIWDCVDAGDYLLAHRLLKRYSRHYGRRRFPRELRLHVHNGTYYGAITGGVWR